MSNNDQNENKSQKDNSKGVPLKCDANGRFDPNLTPEQVGMMSPKDKADYVTQLLVDTLNDNVFREQNQK